MAHGQPDQLLQKTGILNAYYLPGADPRVFYPTISPVNSFRVVFNTYFGASLPLLPGPDAAARVGSAALRVRRHHRSADGGGAAAGSGNERIEPLECLSYNDAIRAEDAEE